MDVSVIVDGLVVALAPQNLLAGFAGVLVGILVGALPGLGPATAIAVLVPITFTMSPETGLIMLIGVFAGAVYGGSISAILLNIPGTSASIVTCWDGYPLARQGRANEALRISVFTSAFGGAISALALLLLSPLIADLALRFAPPEYVALAVFGLAVIASLEAHSLLKGALAALLGLAVSLIGQDPMTGVARFTFGELGLLSGIPLVPVLIGIFVLPELVDMARTGSARAGLYKTTDRYRIKLADVRELGGPSVRGGVIGTLIGALPGAGGTIATFVAYNATKNRSKNPDEFGNGSRTGLAATEASNNGGAASSLIPLLTLGIPGSAAAAVFLGSLTIHGMRPGPRLFDQDAEIVYGFMVGAIIVQVILLVVGLYAAPLFAHVTRLPRGLLIPAVLVLAALGSYALGSNLFDVWIMLSAGILGVAMQLSGLSRAALVLGLILGPIIEDNLARTTQIYGGFDALVTRPVPIVFYALAIIMIVRPYMRTRRQRRLAREKE